MKIQLTQQIIINNRRKEFLPLDELCFLSKNLYNVALYHIRQQYKKDKTYINYNKLNCILSSSNNVDYRALPYAQSAQQVLRQVDKQYISFYKAIKSPKMKGKHVRLPKYKDKEKGRNVFVYTNQCFKLKDNKHISKLTYKRNRKNKDYLHKLSCAIVKYMEANSLNTLFVGKNVGWKDSVDMGKVNNQNFVSIPYNMLIQMLEYKCKLHGIRFVILNEAYTSKCSFLDNEKICKHDIYKGDRKKRGLFISNEGIKINADVNASYNIMRLGLDKINVKLDVLEIRPGNKRFMLNPVSISII